MKIHFADNSLEISSPTVHVEMDAHTSFTVDCDGTMIRIKRSPITNKWEIVKLNDGIGQNQFLVSL